MKLIYVKLTEFQKNKLRREKTSLKVVLDNEQTGDRIYVNDRQYNKIMKGKPVLINFNDTHFLFRRRYGTQLIF